MLRSWQSACAEKVEIQGAASPGKSGLGMVRAGSRLDAKAKPTGNPTQALVSFQAKGEKEAFKLVYGECC